MKQAYIISNKQNQHSLLYRREYSKAQLYLENLGFNVVNPMESEASYCLFTKSNLKKLIESDAVYIMSNVSLDWGNNIEMKISIGLDLIIINGCISDLLKHVLE